MPEITTPQTTETAPAPAQTTPRPPVKPNGGRKKKKMVKNLIILAVVLALLAAGGFALYRFLFSTGGEEGEIFSQPAFLGSIQSKVSGSGTAKAKEDRRHHPQRRAAPCRRCSSLPAKPSRRASPSTPSSAMAA